MNKLRFLSLWASAVLFGAFSAAWADDFSRVVSFGDSLSDSGNAFILSGQVATPPFDVIPSYPYAIGGHHFSNGRTWVEQLAKSLGLQRSSRPALRRPGVFSNYALGGSRARAGASPLPAFAQVGLFLQDFAGQAPGDALYTFGFGGNDVRDALEVFDPDDPSASFAILEDAITAIGDNLVALCNAGAQHVVVSNVPNVGVTPAVRGLGPGAVFVASLLSAQANSALDLTLAFVVQPQCANTQFHVLDAFTTVTTITSDPTAFGFVDADPCLEFDVTGNAICKNPNKKFFWDGIHPTKVGHKILAQDAAALVAGP